jgi:peptidoglycan/xylan/chitin deacetylase (PgdA/CDA1 family)
LTLPLVLLYHIIAPRPADADAEERGLYVDQSRFERQMNDLANRGFESLRLDQFDSAVRGESVPPKAFLLTFDDAYAHVDRAVSPVLNKHGFSAVMFACPSHLGATNTWDSDHPNLSRLEIATRAQLARMARGPWEIASHGQRHIDLRLQGCGRAEELRSARADLSSIIGEPVLDLAYPYGGCDASVREDVRAAGYRMAFTAWHATGAERFQLSRRPIKGTDSMTTFRLKTSLWSDRLYDVREAARSLTGVTTR